MESETSPASIPQGGKDWAIERRTAKTTVLVTGTNINLRWWSLDIFNRKFFQRPVFFKRQSLIIACHMVLSWYSGSSFGTSMERLVGIWCWKQSENGWYAWQAEGRDWCRSHRDILQGAGHQTPEGRPWWNCGCNFHHATRSQGSCLCSLAVVSMHFSVNELLETWSCQTQSKLWHCCLLDINSQEGCFQPRRVKVALDKWSKLPVQLNSILPSQIEVNMNMIGSDTVSNLVRANADAEFLG